MFSRRSALAACFLLLLPALSFATESSAPAAAENPLLAKWTGPYGGVPPFDKVKVADFKPALETAMAENLQEIDAIADNPAKPDFENTIVAARATPAGRSTASRRSTASGQLDDELGRFPDGRDGDGAEARRLQRRDRPERGALRPHRGGLRRARTSEAHARAAAARLASTTRSSSAPGRSSRRREAARRRDQPAPRDPLHEVQPERARRRGRLRPRTSTARPTSPACRSPSGPAPRPPPRRRGHKGQWAITNTRSSMEPFLTYSTRRDLREKVWRTSSAAATTATRTTTTRSSPRS